MRTLKIASMALLTLMAMACTNEKKPPVTERIVEDVNPQTGIISLRDYTINDTISINGKLYKYTCTFEHVDTLPVLMNPQGLEYHESRVRIDIKQNDSNVFSKTFYKNNFRDQVPADFLKTSTVVGVNYNFMKRDTDRSAFYFIITVGDPDETSDNMAYPLELKVATDGSYSIKKAENLETEPLHPGMNIDPSVAGVGAKEIVASTMAVLYHGDITTSGMTPLIAFCFMLFVLLYFPCIPTCIGIKNESGKWKWAGFTILYTTLLAWLTSMLVYQVGSHNLLFYRAKIAFFSFPQNFFGTKPQNSQFLLCPFPQNSQNVALFHYDVPHFEPNDERLMNFSPQSPRA